MWAWGRHGHVKVWLTETKKYRKKGQSKRIKISDLSVRRPPKPLLASAAKRWFSRNGFRLARVQTRRIGLTVNMNYTATSQQAWQCSNACLTARIMRYISPTKSTADALKGISNTRLACDQDIHRNVEWPEVVHHVVNR